MRIYCLCVTVYNLINIYMCRISNGHTAIANSQLK